MYTCAYIDTMFNKASMTNAKNKRAGDWVLEKKGSEFWARLQYNLIGLFVQRELCEDLGWSLADHIFFSFCRLEAALVALLKLCPDMPLERKLPDGYRETWLEAIGDLSLKD